MSTASDVKELAISALGTTDYISAPLDACLESIADAEKESWGDDANRSWSTFFADVKIFLCGEDGSVSDLLFRKNYRVDPAEPECPVGGDHIWQPTAHGSEVSEMICGSCFLRRREHRGSYVCRDSGLSFLDGVVYGRCSSL